MKKLLLTLSATAAVSAPLLSVIGCKTDFSRNIKENRLSETTLHKSDTAKSLQELIQNRFELEFQRSTWYTGFIESTDNLEFDSTTNTYTMSEVPTMAQSIIDTDLIDNMKTIKSNRGNLAADIYSSVEYSIWKNQAIDEDVRALLNDIRTTYDRTKMIYPISTTIVEKDGIKWGEYIFQVDLRSPLDHRFMGKYIELTASIPLEAPSDNQFNKMFDISNPLDTYENSMATLDLLYSTPGRVQGVPTDFWWNRTTDAKATNYLEGTYYDWSSMTFTTDANNDFIINIDKYDATGTNADGEVEFASSIVSTGASFKGVDTLEKVVDHLEKYMFSENENDFVKNLFTNKNGFTGEVEIVNTAGSEIHGRTVQDYVDIFAASHKPGFQYDYSHFNIFINSKTNKSFDWLETDISLTSDGKGAN